MKKQTNDMESLYLLIAVIFIFILFMPIRMKIRFAYNPINNLGSFTYFIFKKRLFAYLFSFKGKGIYLESEKTRKQLEYSYSGPEIKFIEEFNNQMANKIHFKNIEVFLRVGAKDAFFSAMLSGFIQNLVCSFLGMFKNKKDTCSVLINSDTAFNELELQIAFVSRFSISLFDIVYSYLLSVIITKRK